MGHSVEDDAPGLDEGPEEDEDAATGIGTVAVTDRSRVGVSELDGLSLVGVSETETVPVSLLVMDTLWDSEWVLLWVVGVSVSDCAVLVLVLVCVSDCVADFVANSVGVSQ